MRGCYARWSAAAVAALVMELAAGSASADVAYTYDNLGRLSTATYSNGLIVTYAYDLNGNMTSTAITGVKVVVLPLSGFPLIVVN